MNVVGAPSKVLVVGAGLTGACAAWMIRSQKPPVPEVILWDKARGAGGRMSTSRNRNDTLWADLGAQYITARSDSGRLSQIIYDPLVGERLLVKAGGGLPIEGKRDQACVFAEYAAPMGISAVVKRFIEASGVQAEFNKEVATLKLDGSEGGPTPRRQWLVTAKDGSQDMFDCVLLTMPVPQIVDLLRRSELTLDPDVADRLAEVKYSSRYALGLYFEGSSDLAISQTATELWTGSGTYARYLGSERNHKVFRYARLDRSSGGSSVVLHTSIDFGAERIDLPKDQVEAELLQETTRQFPDWPAPTEVKCQKWRYSQVTTPYRGKPGHLWLPLDGRGPSSLMAMGDGFVGSGFENCVESALGAAESLLGRPVQCSGTTLRR